MQREFMIALALAAFAAAGTPAYAGKTKSPVPTPPTTNSPTLLGFCGVPVPCSDAGSNTPTTVNPPVFGFSSGGHDAKGYILIDILLPNNVAHPPSFTFTTGSALGGGPYTATLVPSSPWTGGSLDTFLGLAGNASPANKLDAYLNGPTGTQIYQPSATGFNVYSVDIGQWTLPKNSVVGTSAEDPYLMQLGQSLAQGSYIVAYIDVNGNFVAGDNIGATANSGAIFETTAPRRPLPEPATWGMMLVGFGGIGAAMRRRRKTGFAQLA